MLSLRKDLLRPGAIAVTCNASLSFNSVITVTNRVLGLHLESDSGEIASE